MAKFHSLIVTDVENTIRDAIVVSLKPEGDAADFDFTQGQYLTFRQVIGGTEIRRSYSICAGKGEGLKVGIKRVDGGAFSNWANDTLVPGIRLEGMVPMGSFHTAIEPELKKLYRLCRRFGHNAGIVSSQNNFANGAAIKIRACLCKSGRQHDYVQGRA